MCMHTTSIVFENILVSHFKTVYDHSLNAYIITQFTCLSVGDVGPIGRYGAPGKTGLPGPTGERGIKGMKGEIGEIGKSLLTFMKKIALGHVDFL